MPVSVMCVDFSDFLNIPFNPSIATDTNTWIKVLIFGLLSHSFMKHKDKVIVAEFNCSVKFLTVT